MYDEINKLKNEIENRRKILEGRNKRIEDEISVLENQITLKYAEFNKRVFDMIIENIYSIQQSIEKWDSLKFDGFHINRNLDSVLIFFCDNNSNNYEISFEDGEFKFMGDVEEYELSEDFKYIVSELNSLLNYI